MESKFFLKSKVFWTVIILAVLSFSPYVEFIAVQHPNLYTGAILFIFSILRLFTASRIDFKQSGERLELPK